MTTINFEGWALVLGAVGVLLGSVGNFTISMVTLWRQGANKIDTDKKLEGLHVQGNSNMETTRQLSESLGIEKGKAIGVVQERANPMEPKKA